MIYPCISYELRPPGTSPPNANLCTPQLQHERGVFRKPSQGGACFAPSHRGCSFAPPRGRFRIAIPLFTLFCGQCDPMIRKKPQRGERVGAEIETPVGKTAITVGNRAASGGARGGPVRRNRPGPGPARQRADPRQRRPGFRGAQEGRRVRRPSRLRPQDHGPLLRRPGRRHRRLDKRHVPGQGGREEEKRRLGVFVGVPRPGRAPRSRPRPGLPAGHAGRRRGRRRGATSTPSSPSTSRGASGTRFSRPSARRDGRKPSPGG